MAEGVTDDGVGENPGVPGLGETQDAGVATRRLVHAAHAGRMPPTGLAGNATHRLAGVRRCRTAPARVA